MRRSTALMGIVFIGVATALLNMSSASPISISWSFAILLMVAWYFACWVNIIQEWERRPVMLFGRYMYTSGPGLTLIEPIFFTTLHDVTVQDVTTTVKADVVQTKDNVSVGLSAVLTYRMDPDNVRKAVVEVYDVHRAVLSRALAALTDVPATQDLDGLLEHRDKVGPALVEKLRERVEAWGVTIKAFEIQSLKINDAEVEKAIAMRARAQKEAEAELQRAKMQKQIVAALNDAAADLSPEGWRLKGIETFIEAVRGPSNTILIPASLADGLGHLLPRLDAPTPVTRPNGAHSA